MLLGLCSLSLLLIYMLDKENITVSSDKRTNEGRSCVLGIVCVLIESIFQEDIRPVVIYLATTPENAYCNIL